MMTSCFITIAILWNNRNCESVGWCRGQIEHMQMETVKRLTQA